MRHIYSVLAAIVGSFGRACGELLSGLMRGGRLLGAMVLLAVAVAGCGDRETLSASIPLDAPRKLEPIVEARAPQPVTEVSAPIVLQKLRSRFERYRPQVSIVSPAPNSVIESDTVTVSLKVTGLPLFQDDRFGLGPHLHLLLDDQPDQLVFDTSEPIQFSNLTPGTHTLRVFAARPWSESFKNEGAFAQTTFHVYTKTGKNEPDPSRPLLTYNQPRGTYGSEPILLDFYLTNAPLHAIAQEFEDDAIHDWRVRVTLNGQQFTLDRWEPLYLKGVKPGQNWLQLELIDEQGDLIDNVFNSTVHLFQYDNQLQDGLAVIVGGEVSFEEALSVAGAAPLPEEANPEAAIDSSAGAEPSEDEQDEQAETGSEAVEPSPELDPAPSDSAQNTQNAEDTEVDPAAILPEALPEALPETPIETEPIPSTSEASDFPADPEIDTGADTELETESPELDVTEPRPEEQTTPEDFETIDPSAINGEKSSDIVRDEAQITEITETPETEMNAPASDVSQTSAATETFSDSTAAIADPTPSQGDLNRDRHSTLPTNPPEVEENEMDLTLPSTPDR